MNQNPATSLFSRYLTKRPTLAAINLYALLLILIYSPVLLNGKSLQPPLYSPHGVINGHMSGKAELTAANTFSVDTATPAYYEWPTDKLVGDLYKSKNIPIWNPYQGGGVPLVAQYSTRAFFPLQIIQNISPPSTWDYFLLLRLLIAGTFTYLFLSRLGLSYVASLFGGAAYMFSGAFVWFINLEQFTNTAMTIPIVIYTVERLVRRVGGTVFFSIDMVLAGGAIGLMLLAGQPEIALYGSLLAFLYFMVRLYGRQGRGAALKGLRLFSSSYFMGLLFAGPVIVPFLELVVESHHIHAAGGVMGVQTLQNWRSIFAVLNPGATLLLQDPLFIFGGCDLTAFGSDFYRLLPINGLWDSLGGFTGSLVLLLSLVGLPLVFRGGKRDLRGPQLFFLILGISVLLKNLGIAPFLWIGKLPLFDQVWSLRWAGPAWVFALSASAAIGLHTVMSGGGKGEQGTGPYIVERRPALVILLATLIVALPFTLYSLLPSLSLLGEGTVFGEGVDAFIYPSIILSSFEAIAVLLSGALMLALLLSGNGRYSAWGVLMLLIVDLWWPVPRGYGAETLALKWIPLALGILASFIILLAGGTKSRGEGRLLLSKALSGISILMVILFAASTLYVDNRASTDPLGTGLPLREDLFTGYGPYNTPPYVEFLKGLEDTLGDTDEGHFRVTGGGGVLFPNYASTVGLQDLHYVNALTLKRFHNFRGRYLHRDYIEEEPTSSLWFTGLGERCQRVEGDDPDSGRGIYKRYGGNFFLDIIEGLRGYSFMGVRYIVTPKETDKEVLGPGFPLVYDNEVRIYENRVVIPRVFFTNDYIVEEDYKKAQEIAFTSTFDLSERVVIDKEPYYAERINKGNKVTYNAEFTHFEPNLIKVDLKTDESGILVLTDNLYPGWKVVVNGKRGTMIEVNGLVRGVYVDDGESSITFVYFPYYVFLGFLFFISAGFLFTFVIYTRWHEEG